MALPQPRFEPTVAAQYKRYKRLIENAYAKDIGNAIGVILEDEEARSLYIQSNKLMAFNVYQGGAERCSPLDL